MEYVYLIFKFTKKLKIHCKINAVPPIPAPHPLTRANAALTVPWAGCRVPVLRQARRAHVWHLPLFLFHRPWRPHTLFYPWVCAAVLALLSCYTLQASPCQYVQSSLIIFLVFLHTDAACSVCHCSTCGHRGCFYLFGFKQLCISQLGKNTMSLSKCLFTRVLPLWWSLLELLRIVQAPHFFHISLWFIFWDLLMPTKQDESRQPNFLTQPFSFWRRSCASKFSCIPPALIPLLFSHTYPSHPAQAHPGGD